MARIDEAVVVFLDKEMHVDVSLSNAENIHNIIRGALDVAVRDVLGPAIVEVARQESGLDIDSVLDKALG